MYDKKEIEQKLVSASLNELDDCVAFVQNLIKIKERGYRAPAKYYYARQWTRNVGSCYEYSGFCRQPGAERMSGTWTYPMYDLYAYESEEARDLDVARGSRLTETDEETEIKRHTALSWAQAHADLSLARGPAKVDAVMIHTRL